MENLKKILFLLSKEEKKQASLILVMILFMALLEMLGVASILPFMAMLANPEILDTNVYLNKAYIASSLLGVKNENQFLFFLGIMVLTLLVLSLSFKALTIYAQLRFASKSQFSISTRILKTYIGQSYSWFLNRHSADLGKNILSEVGMIVSSGLKPMMHLIAQSIVAITILALLIVVDPYLALIVFVTLSLAYGLVYKFIKGFLTRIGEERVKANEWRFTAISEAFGAVKEIKVGGLEKTFIEKFSYPAKIFAQHQASSQVINQLPRFALEAIAFGGMLVMVLYSMAKSGTFTNAVPVIALYAFAGYRLLPALQGIYGSFTQLRFVGPALRTLHKDLISLQKTKPSDEKIINKLKLDKKIDLKNVCYNYPNSSRTALKNINLQIPANSTVGIVGATGSGKTTTVDIILGLLEPQKGVLEIDGKIINKQNLRSWQKSIGYVPQQIYLADDTVQANIAFGLDKKNVDKVAVERAAKIANLHDFITNELPLSYQTTVGERGVRLSGGQRQRIGIARALYHNPQVLILDEATSALDNLTEQSVMKAVHNFGKDITIIIIAHRLSTVKKCDKIFLLDKGELKNQGDFETLVKISDIFKATAIKA